MNRPDTLQAVAEAADSFEAFGRYFQDWLHAVRRASSRPELARAITAAPPILARRFAGGGVADAWLAAYAETVARRIGRPAPAWTKGRVSPEPWFGAGADDVRSRLAALRDSPPAFKSRNLYVPMVDLPLRLRAGRPAKPPDERRHANAERQRRFRARRRREFAAWRKLRRTGR